MNSLCAYTHLIFNFDKKTEKTGETNKRYQSQNPTQTTSSITASVSFGKPMTATMLSSQDSMTTRPVMDMVGGKFSVGVNPYQILQVRRDATPSEIRHAYRRLALWHHPGRCVGETATAEERSRRLHVFEVLAASYETLLDNEARLRCDKLLREQYAEMSRSKNIPAGQVNVGGRPFSPNSKSFQQDENYFSESFVAQVIGQLAVHTMISSFDALDDTNPNNAIPTVASLSSDSSLEDKSRRPREHDDDSSHSSFVSGTAVRSTAVRTPRIHIPLGVPIGTPLRETSPHDLIDSQGVPLNQREQNFLSLNCGINTLPSFDAQQIPPFINSTTTSEQNLAEVHYTESETNHLFGGPLQLLYRARRWKSFRNPYDVFADVFGSQVYLGHNPTSARGSGSTAGYDLALPAQSSNAVWKRTSRTLKDGTILYNTSRIVHNRRMTRTEAVWTDVDTGERHSKVTVVTEILEDLEGTNGDEDGTTGWLTYLATCGKLETDADNHSVFHCCGTDASYSCGGAWSWL